ncbi:ABC transporter permease [Ekhidna sp.]|jgi:putative ABC transport system permease protein|uniref:ABC transporter permease n=1 Tax=Ekhidna sp. TaxID=2608089 RepID=UPI0032ECC0A8
MLKNYLKLALRNLSKRKLFTIINAVGFSVGIAFCLLIFLFIKDELSFDEFHINKDNIYRIEAKRFNKSFNTASEDFPNLYNYSAYLQAGLAAELKESVSQVKYSTRFSSGFYTVKYEDQKFKETIHFTDPDFFKMFSFNLLSGDPNSVFRDRNSVVITPELATKYFGDVNPIGKVLSIAENNFSITGIIESPPSNSSVQFDILLPAQANRYISRSVDDWLNFNTYTFVQLSQNANLEVFHSSLRQIVDKYMSTYVANVAARHNVPEGVFVFDYQYKNLSHIHLDTQVSWPNSSNPNYSFILGGIAVLILIIACINYVSLALTTSASRKKEVGVRKALGAQRNQIRIQFTVESVALVIISTILSIVFVNIFLPSFNEFTNKAIRLDYSLIGGLAFIGLLLAFVIGLFAGYYPAFILSKYNPVKVLKSGHSLKFSISFIQPLVVIQFAVSAFLIISSIIMYRQMEYITSKDLGFDKEQVLVVPTQAGWGESTNKFVERMRTRLLQEPEFESLAGTNISFNRGYARKTYGVDGEMKSSFIYTVDPHYIETLNINIKEGRNFRSDIPSDSNALIVNQALVEDMGWNNPLEEHLNWQGDTTGLGYKIIGVTEDYHFQSLESQVEPTLLTLKNGYLSNMLIKIKPGKVNIALNKVEDIYKELMPNNPFEYSFLDDDLAEQYIAYQRWMNVMALSTLFAILISCLGLFGISGVNVVNRTKEIGIRKVFGADLKNIFILINKKYLFLSVISFLIAIPFSWYVMKKWLSNFYYSVGISWHVFVIGVLLGIIIAMITVTYHSLKAAKMKATDTLKYE